MVKLIKRGIGKKTKEDHDQSKASKRQLSQQSAFLLVAGFILVAFGLNGLYDRWHTTHQPAVAKKPELLIKPVTNSTDNPDETKIDPSANYQVAKDMPKKITMSTINEEGFIQQVGVDQHVAIAVPNNVHLAGWYNQSVKPGETGISIIDGHVQGKYSEGIFKRLVNLKTKDNITVEYGDGSKKNFEVVDVNSYSVADATKNLNTKIDGAANQLDLITCGGKFDSKTSQYEQRVIVRTKLVANL